MDVRVILAAGAIVLWMLICRMVYLVFRNPLWSKMRYIRRRSRVRNRLAGDMLPRGRKGSQERSRYEQAKRSSSDAYQQMAGPNPVLRRRMWWTAIVGSLIIGVAVLYL